MFSFSTECNPGSAYVVCRLSDDGPTFVNTHPIWHNHPMCGRYRLSRRAQIIAEEEQCAFELPRCHETRARCLIPRVCIYGECEHVQVIVLGLTKSFAIVAQFTKVRESCGSLREVHVKGEDLVEASVTQQKRRIVGRQSGPQRGTV
jgi:hypothetical protein